MENYVQPPTSGPRPIGQLAAVAVGAYTDIVEIRAPSEAAYGDEVNIRVRVKNLSTDPIYIAVTGHYDGVDIFPTEDYAIIDPGATRSFYFPPFPMPNKDIWFQVWSWYWTGEEWYQDDYEYVYIALVAVVEPYAGAISRKELEYDEARASIPAYNIPQGKRGLVHIWGRNDMTTTQRMGIWWAVWDPDGYVVEEYSAWESWPYTGPGSAHEFIGGRFPLDKPGTYTIVVDLEMNPDDPVVVDTYGGTLCTVAAVVPEPEFRGFEVTEYVKR